MLSGRRAIVTVDGRAAQQGTDCRAILPLQVELCLTAEGSDRSVRLASLRGLDALTYYRGANDSVLNTGHPVVRDLIISALRHWRSAYRLDGFVFVSAENMAMDMGGVVQVR